jgi:hypothetical protein
MILPSLTVPRDSKPYSNLTISLLKIAELENKINLTLFSFYFWFCPDSSHSLLVKTMVPVIKIDGAKIKNQILYDAIT